MAAELILFSSAPCPARPGQVLRTRATGPGHHTGQARLTSRPLYGLALRRKRNHQRHSAASSSATRPRGDQGFVPPNVI